MAVKDRRDAVVGSARGIPHRDCWDLLGVTIQRILPRTWPMRLLLLLLVAGLGLRLVWLASPDGALIFDETYYVNASRSIAGYAPKEVYADAPRGLDPNVEHPPLAKLIVASSMTLFGDNPYAWRLPSVAFGMLSIAMMFLITRALTDHNWLGLLVATIFSFDNLVFVHSRIFTLDIFLVGFMLFGLYAYLIGRPGLAGAAFALAALCKVPGMFGIAALLGYECLRVVRVWPTWEAEARLAAIRLLKAVVIFAIVFLALLWAFDRLWVGFDTPVAHLRRILDHGVALSRPAGPSGVESAPWQWLLNERPIPYIRVEQQILAGDEVVETRPVVLFVGALNPYVLALLPFGLGLAVVQWQRVGRTADLHALGLAWFLATYLPLCAAALFGNRISYLFYVLPSVPTIAWTGALFLMEGRLPRTAIIAYLIAVLLAFVGHFPFKWVE